MRKEHLKHCKIGIKGYVPSILSEGGSYCEVTLSELSAMTPNAMSNIQGRLVIVCGLRELKQDCWDELKDRLEQLGPLAILWTLPPQFPLWGDLSGLFENIRDRNLSPEWHYFDAPFPLKGIWSRPQNVVSDPLAPASMGLALTPAKSPYWRIHGWHTERWVRLYAPTQIQSLARSIKQHTPMFVTLAHSQRNKQWFELRDALALQTMGHAPGDPKKNVSRIRD
jgi:hypothetical protein